MAKNRKKPFKTKKRKVNVISVESVNATAAHSTNCESKIKQSMQKEELSNKWQKVDIASESAQNKHIIDGNHYDDEDADFGELYDTNEGPGSSAGDDFGIFSGMLEVIDGNDFLAEKSGENVSRSTTAVSEVAPKKKKKSKKKKSAKTRSVEASKNLPQPSSEDLETTSLNWKEGTGAMTLHPSLVTVLAARKFLYPTPIQSRTLASSIYGCDIVGAAPTGSGKTIAYLLPILNHVLNQRDLDGMDDKKMVQNSLVAMIITPTRELALQVTDEARILSSSTNVCTIVGGLAHAKQIRQLSSSPSIIVATPGRLWELMSSEDRIVPDLRSLRYLVVDEADRLMIHGKFTELQNILSKLVDQNKVEDSRRLSEGNDIEQADLDGVNLDLGGEVHVEMLPSNISEEYESSTENRLSGEVSSKPDFCSRQTFVYSATLTLETSLLTNETTEISKINSKTKSRSKVDGPIADILARAKSQNKVKVIDLGLSDNAESRSLKNTGLLKSANLPPGLSLFEVKCTQKHKDSYLYGLLVCTNIGKSGPSLVFCNSIVCVKRVYALLNALKLPVKMLHAELNQKSRMQAIESLSKPKSRSIVVCTDVAARGIDIDSISTVIHYDVARAIDTFVHRSGRTARGVGEKAVGNSVTLVSSAEEKKHKNCCLAVGRRSFDVANIDGRLMKSVQERVNLASKIVSYEQAESKSSQENSWYIKAAEEAGIDLDEDLLEGAMDGKTNRERKRHEEGRKANAKLMALLSQPMRTQNFGKFLSGIGLQQAIKMESEITPHTYIDDKEGTRKSRKKRKKN